MATEKHPEFQKVPAQIEELVLLYPSLQSISRGTSKNARTTGRGPRHQGRRRGEEEEEGRRGRGEGKEVRRAEGEEKKPIHKFLGTSLPVTPE